MIKATELSVKVYADGADLDTILRLAGDPLISGFTTNPSLMRKAGLSDYETFAKELLSQIDRQPVSFEVFADDLDGMHRQARIISSWADNVFVKIPVTNTKGEPTTTLVRRLSEEGVKVNVTALFSPEQVEQMALAVSGGARSNLSVFAGRIADAGVDPVPIMSRCVEIASVAPDAELIWASPREVLNVVQAQQVGCHIITMTNDLIVKLGCLGKDLLQFSLETVQMFHRDAASAGLAL